MEHRGEIIEKAIRQSGLPIIRIAEKLGKSRQWIYDQFQNPNIPYETVMEIGKIIHTDFSGQIKNINKALSDPEDQYENQANNAAYWREKYYTLLEEYHELSKKQTESK